MGRVTVDLKAIQDLARSPEVKQALLKAAEAAASRARELVPVDTGELRDSIYAEETEEGARFGATADHAAHVEFGTWKMAAQPFLRPAVDAMKRVQ